MVADAHLGLPELLLGQGRPGHEQGEGGTERGQPVHARAQWHGSHRGTRLPKPPSHGVRGRSIGLWLCGGVSLNTTRPGTGRAWSGRAATKRAAR
jgi:hypothetical protein